MLSGVPKKILLQIYTKKLDPMILVQEQLKINFCLLAWQRQHKFFYNLIVYIAKVLITLTLVKRMFTLS